MRLYVYILLCVSLLSCRQSTNKHGDINLVNTKKGETEVIFHNNNTTTLNKISIFLSVNQLLKASPIRVELKVTAPNGSYWIDTLTIKNNKGNVVGFSGRKELYYEAYNNVSLMQGGDYKFTTRTIDIKSDLIYMIGVIIENKDSGKR